MVLPDDGTGLPTSGFFQIDEFGLTEVGRQDPPLRDTLCTALVKA